MLLLNRKPGLRGCLLLILMLLGWPDAWAQRGEVKTNIQFLSSETIAEVNLNQEEFLAYIKRFNTDLEAAAALLNRTCEVQVVHTLHKTQPVSVEVSANPALSQDEAQKVAAQLRALPAPHTRFTDFSLLYRVAVNGGPPSGAPAGPALRLPAEQQQAAFEALPLAEQCQQVRAWASQEALPILAAFETKTDTRFAGVHGMGTILEGLPPGTVPNVPQLTDHSYTYWRGCLEMDRGNPLVVMNKVLLYAAAGEFGQAQLYWQLLQPVSDRKAVATQLGEELDWRLKALNQQANARIQAGIALNDQNKYDEALAVYEQVLTAYPASAWANYEKFFTERARYMAQHNGRPDDAMWERARKVIFAANPMYPSVGQIGSGAEAYQFAKRQELTKLFKNRENFEADYKAYADTALLLGEYGLAAQLNWIIFSTMGSKGQPDQQRLATFLYCLDKLGDHQIATNFKGNFKAQFASIEARLDKDMKDSPAYKSFKKK